MCGTCHDVSNPAVGDLAHNWGTQEVGLEPGTYTNVSGNAATAWGLIAAAKLAGLDLFYGTYPITPASPMGEWADSWSAEGQPNLWGSVPEVVEMQSEAGAAGAIYLGTLALLKNALLADLLRSLLKRRPERDPGPPPTREEA